MEKAYRYRIYPSKEQRIQLAKTFGCCRFVFNHFLSRRKYVYEYEERTLGFYECSKELTLLKKQYDWLYKADADTDGLSAVSARSYD